MKKWACPPCRGYCNCSICRRKQGRDPTGQLSQRAIADGYKSVRHFLSSTEGETTNETISDEYEDEDEDDEGNNGELDDKSTNDNNNELNDADVQRKNNIVNEESKTDNLKETNNVKNESNGNGKLLKPNKIILKNYCCEDDSNENCELHVKEEDDGQTFIDKYYKQLILNASRRVVY